MRKVVVPKSSKRKHYSEENTQPYDEWKDYMRLVRPNSEKILDNTPEFVLSSIKGTLKY